MIVLLALFLFVLIDVSQCKTVFETKSPTAFQSSKQNTVSSIVYGANSNNPGKPVTRDDVNTARYLMLQHRYYAANDYLDRALKANPNDAEIHCALADCLFARSFYDEAFAHYCEAEKLAPERQELKLRIAICFAQLADFKAAEKELLSAKSDKDESSEFYLASAMINFQEKRFRSAIKDCRKALKKEPFDKQAVIEMSMCYSEMRQHPKALKLLSDCLSRTPDDLDLLSEVGRSKMLQHKFSEAFHFFTRMIAIEKNRVDAYQLKGSCYEQTGEWTKALACYKQVTGLSAGDPTISSYICALLLKQNEFDLAAPYVATALRQTPNTDFIIKEATKALVDLPKNLRRTILAGDTRIVIAPTISHYLPYLSKYPPEGYPSGQTWAYVPGYFDGSNIIVPEQIRNSEGNMILNKNTYFSTMHEFGHVFNSLKKGLASTEQFKYCYTLDCEGLQATDSTKYAYFLQPDGQGRSELFAALFELYVCRLVGRKERQGSLSLKFPHCYDFVFRKLEQ